MRSFINLNQINIIRPSFGGVSLRATSKCVHNPNHVNNQQIRHYSDKKPDGQEVWESFLKPMSQIKHVSYTGAFGVPRLFNSAFTYLYIATRMSQIDKNFNKEQFTNDCKEATLVFCKLLADNEVEKCEELMTPEAYQKLAHDFKDADEETFETLSTPPEDVIHSNLIFLEDFEKDGKKFVQATFTMLKKSNVEEIRKIYPLSDLIIVKFLRDYSNAQSSEWLISYFDYLHLKRDLFKSKTKEDD